MQALLLGCLIQRVHASSLSGLALHNATVVLLSAEYLDEVPLLLLCLQMLPCNTRLSPERSSDRKSRDGVKRQNRRNTSIKVQANPKRAHASVLTGSDHLSVTCRQRNSEWLGLILKM